MNTPKNRGRGLGRGLSALMADVEPATSQTAPRSADRFVPVEALVANPDQPRRVFREEDLEDLTRSVKEKGVIQPLIVRPRDGHAGEFEIVAGERRWRAAQRAQLHEVPVVVRNFDDTEVLEVAIIENIQRADLNAVEEAQGYRQLMDRFGHTQEKLGEALGKSRSHIANLLRLLSLPDDVQSLLADGKLSAGHARALITSEDPSGLARTVVSKGLSVRDTEKLAKGSAQPKAQKRYTPPSKDADTRALETDLSATLGMKVQVNHSESSGGGQLIVKYTSLEQLDDLCGKLSR